MKFEIEVIGRVLIVKDENGNTICAGSPRECAEVLKVRFKAMVGGGK